MHDIVTSVFCHEVLAGQMALQGRGRVPTPGSCHQQHVLHSLHQDMSAFRNVLQAMFYQILVIDMPCRREQDVGLPNQRLKPRFASLDSTARAAQPNSSNLHLFGQCMVIAADCQHPHHAGMTQNLDQQLNQAGEPAKFWEAVLKRMHKCPGYSKPEVHHSSERRRVHDVEHY